MKKKTLKEELKEEMELASEIMGAPVIIWDDRDGEGVVDTRIQPTRLPRELLDKWKEAPQNGAAKKPRKRRSRKEPRKRSS